MEEKKPKFVPMELKGRMVKNNYKNKPTDPDWKGSFMYQGQVINFGAWEADAGYGTFYKISLSDPNWREKRQQYPKDVTPFDSDVPF